MTTKYNSEYIYNITYLYSIIKYFKTTDVGYTLQRCITHSF